MFGFFKDYKESGKLDDLLKLFGQFFMMFIQTLGIVIGMVAVVIGICALMFLAVGGIFWIVSHAGWIAGSIVSLIAFAFCVTVWGWFSGYRP